MVAKEEEATKTVKMIGEGKNKKLLSLIPEGQSPKLYLDLIKDQIFTPDKSGKQRSDADLLLFLYTAKRTGLDPLANQIHAVFRWDSRLGREKMTIQTGIDGLRLVAQRSGDYAGQDDAICLPTDESTKYPIKATVTVYKMVKGARIGFTATARWKEYAVFNQTKDGLKLSPLWERMPYRMLEKCAEALALRKGFPNELSGIYTSEEMEQINNPILDLPTPESIAKKDKVVVLNNEPTPAEPIKEVEPVGAEEAKEASEAIKEKMAKDSANPAPNETRKSIAELRKDIAEGKEQNVE
ncbi:MAG: hypothetical protein MOGMAGMI_01823 [Candidatus Omnitrophica bacterium]|nr:hypothetical protein [Ignavibacteriaceae bacterium]MCG3176859.1 hypothetical protein [Candidatus Omnitrophota bacterium]